MRLAILSDSHDAWGNLEWGVNIAMKNNCEVLLFAGDLVSPNGIEILREFSGEIHVIWGNNEGEKMKMTRMVSELKINHHDWWYEGEIGSKKIVMHHWPRPMEVAAQSQLFDLAICGHTHEWRLEKFNKTMLVNPGAICGSKSEKPSMAIVDLDTMEFSKFEMEL